TAPFGVSVTFSWSGVLQPINPDNSSVFNAGSTVPVKFRLTDASAGITDLSAKLSITKINNFVPGPVNETTSSSIASSGNLFSYDPVSGLYVFKWSSRGLGTGTYQLQIDLGDGVAHTVKLALR